MKIKVTVKVVEKTPEKMPEKVQEMVSASTPYQELFIKDGVRHLGKEFKPNDIIRFEYEFPSRSPYFFLVQKDNKLFAIKFFVDKAGKFSNVSGSLLESNNEDFRETLKKAFENKIPHLVAVEVFANKDLNPDIYKDLVSNIKRDFYTETRCSSNTNLMWVLKYFEDLLEVNENQSTKSVTPKKDDIIKVCSASSISNKKIDNFYYVGESEIYMFTLSEKGTFHSYIGKGPIKVLEKIFEEPEKYQVHSAEIIASPEKDSTFWFDIAVNLAMLGIIEIPQPKETKKQESEEQVSQKQEFYYEIHYVKPNVSIYFACPEKLLYKEKILDYFWNNKLEPDTSASWIRDIGNVMFAQGISEQEFKQKVRDKV